MIGILHSMANMEQKMISVRRCLNMKELPQEKEGQPKKENWPTKGEVEFKEV